MNKLIPYHKTFPLDPEDLEVIKWRIEDTLKNQLISNGMYCRILEETVKKMYNVKYAITTSNCTMGLILCDQYYDWLRPLHMPNFTWSSPHLLLPNRFKQFHDIDKRTWLMQSYPPSGVLMPVHTFGNILEISHGKRKVIYDGAHAFGAEIKDIGNATVFSLAPTKLITAGEGGIVITNEKKLAMFVRYRMEKMCRMSEANAIMGLQYLEHKDEILAWKKEVFEYYSIHLPAQFQEIPITSNYNTIGFLNIASLVIPEHIEWKQYYKPIFERKLMPNAYYVWKHMVCLPSYYKVDYKKIVRDIKELNKL